MRRNGNAVKPKYPTAQEMAKVTQDELRQTLIAIGAKSAATKPPRF
jgi:hypothetical protein